MSLSVSLSLSLSRKSIRLSDVCMCAWASMDITIPYVVGDVDERAGYVQWVSPVRLSRIRRCNLQEVSRLTLLDHRRDDPFGPTEIAR